MYCIFVCFTVYKPFLGRTLVTGWVNNSIKTFCKINAVLMCFSESDKRLKLFSKFIALELLCCNQIHLNFIRQRASPKLWRLSSARGISPRSVCTTKKGINKLTIVIRRTLFLGDSSIFRWLASLEPFCRNCRCESSLHQKEKGKKQSHVPCRAGQNTDVDEGRTISCVVAEGASRFETSVKSNHNHELRPPPPGRAFLTDSGSFGTELDDGSLLLGSTTITNTHTHTTGPEEVNQKICCFGRKRDRGGWGRKTNKSFMVEQKTVEGKKITGKHTAQHSGQTFLNSFSFGKSIFVKRCG